MLVKKNNKSLTIISAIYILLITIACFNGFENRSLYLFSGISLMALSALLFLYCKPIKQTSHLFSLIIIWIMYHLFLFAKDLTTISGYTAFQHIGVVLFFWFMINLIQTKNSKLIKDYLKIIHYILMIFLLFIVTFRKSVMTNYETLVYIGLATIIYPTFDFKKRKNIKVFLLSFIWSYISYTIGARAQIMSFIIYALSYLVLKKVNFSKKFLNRCFIIYYIILNVFPIIYTWLSVSPYSEVLNNIALNLTSSRFFSGRNILWNGIYSRMSGLYDVIFGLGLNSTGLIVRSNISLHSLYVTIFSEGGLIFIIILGMLLYQIWKMLNEKNDLISKAVMAIMIAILYKQSFDISLLENNICYAIVIWLSFASGFYESKEKVVKEVQKNEKKYNLINNI